mmetsp:Transcript_60054/g.107140  ORF Transcript_60054/g.107140 Transcript_60054/m.107140 type:complete len:200 (-) Transcript_60054:597-1196(-)
MTVGLQLQSPLGHPNHENASSHSVASHEVLLSRTFFWGDHRRPSVGHHVTSFDGVYAGRTLHRPCPKLLLRWATVRRLLPALKSTPKVRTLCTHCSSGPGMTTLGLHPWPIRADRRRYTGKRSLEVPTKLLFPFLFAPLCLPLTSRPHRSTQAVTPPLGGHLLLSCLYSFLCNYVSCHNGQVQQSLGTVVRRATADTSV